MTITAKHRPAPSLKRLEAAFPGKGAELRALLKGEKKTSDYQSVRDLVSQSYHHPSYAHRLMTALDEIIEGYGVEAVWDKSGSVAFEYVNMGDTYTTTIVRWYDSGHIEVTDWGTIVERDNGRRFW